MVAWRSVLVLGLLLAAPASCRADGAAMNGFSVAGVTPAIVDAPGTATVAVSVTAPAGGSSTVVGLGRRSSIVPVPSITKPIRGRKTADDGLGSADVPTLNVRSAQLDGPGVLSPLPVPAWAAARGGCTRDGVLSWGAAPSYRLDLPAGQTTRLLVHVDVPRGLASHPPVLEFQLHAWQATVPPADSLSGPVGDPAGIIQASIPRGTGAADEVSLQRRPGSHGTHRLSGTVTPARAGQRVEIVGRSARTTSRTTAYLTLDNVIHDKITSQRRLAVATTNARGEWSARIRLTRKTVLVARTTHGLGGTSSRGASCPLTLG